MIGLNGENLIFLISQPRSGSTLLQRILAGSRDIHTTAEPWIALAPVFALRDGPTAAYNAALGREATQDFLQTLPNGEQSYWEASAAMLRSLYNQSLFNRDSWGGIVPEKKKFLDKTPRYYHIIPELRRMFPRAAFIFLLRDPLAVFASIKIWTPEGEDPCVRFHDDLLLAPKLILEGIKLVDSPIVVRYEDLVTDPDMTLSDVGCWLDITVGPEMLEYGSRPPPAGKMGDTLISANSRPTVESLEKWKSLKDDPFAESYLQQLDAAVCAELGYPVEAMQHRLKGLKHE